MGRLLWPLALLITFFVGWGVAGIGRAPTRPPADADQQETLTRLQQQVETLQARLRAREELASVRSSRSMDEGRAPGVAADERIAPDGAMRSANGAPVSTPAGVERASATTPRTSAAAVHAALDRFYKYLEASNETTGRGRWREARELVEELRAMGAPAGQALMQVLASGNDTDERRAAARLLGQLQVAQALP